MTRARVILTAVWVFLLLVFLWGSLAFAQSRINSFNCEEPYSLCPERIYNRSYDPEYKGRYIGHDEPTLVFYSDVAGSGNYNQYKIILPKDPATYPTDANPKGTGGPTVWNFQLHPAFWFGMPLCDSESYPEFTHRCTPDSDENIFDDSNPKSKKYIGHHPGTAFMEMQFYPPGWLSSFSANQYAAALNIFSLNVKDPGPNGPLALGGGILNNNACLNSVGMEPGNFALITLDGTSQAPGDPLSSDRNRFATIPGKTFLMNPGDTLVLTMHDTPHGLEVIIRDLTTKQTGRMTASSANGFAQVKFDPKATTCTSRPYAFHPMYATSGPHTRTPWGAGHGTIEFSDEIGHFNYCDAQDDSIIPGLGVCLASPVESEFDPASGVHEADDQFCVDPASSLVFGFGNPPLGGCLDSDVDFDGVPYHHAWAGSGPDTYGFSAVPEPIRFTSPKFRPAGSKKEDSEKEDSDKEDLRSYSRVAFEPNLPSIEVACDRLTGAGCVNPPPGALFYPIYTTTTRDEQCWWQFGGASIPGTTNNFGGSSATEYGTLEALVYIAGTTANPGSGARFRNFYRALPHNPCVNE